MSLRGRAIAVGVASAGGGVGAMAANAILEASTLWGLGTRPGSL